MGGLPWLPQNPGIDLIQFTDAEVLTIQNISGLGDPGADRILFWDESANAYAYLTIGSGLTITDTTITATTGGTGTVTDVSVVTANGISGSVATSTTTPAITLTLGAITPTTVNGLTLASQTTGFTIAGGTTSKTLTVPLDASVSGTNTGDQDLSGLVPKSLYDSNTILYATTDNTPVALTVGTNTVIGRVSGDISTLAIDSDLTSVSASDDTIPSAKATKTALDLKAPLTSPTFATSITGSYLTASEILITDGSKNIVSAPVATYPSLTELSYVKGLSSAIQTQLGTKAVATTTMTIAGTANQITSSAGAQDLSANRTWTLSLPADVLIPTVLTVPNTGLHLLDSNASHDLIIKPGSDLTADKTLTITTGDADVILNLTAVTDEYVLAYDSGTNTWRGVEASGSGADTALSNLASVQIDTDLVFADDSVPTTYHIKVDDQAASNVDGNALYILSGKGNGTGQGGFARFGSSDRSGTLSAGMDIYLGSATVGSGLITISSDEIDGGSISCGGSRVYDNSSEEYYSEGGDIEIDASNSTFVNLASQYTQATAGDITLRAGDIIDNTSSKMAGGARLYLEGGTWISGTYTGGSLFFDVGQGDDANGSIQFTTNGDYYGTLNFNNLTADKTFTFPNTTGTLALVTTTSDTITVGTIELGHASDTTLTRVSAGVVAIEGSNILVSGGALGTPSSGTLTNCGSLPISGLTSSTSTALGVGSIELGHASDTTIARVSAGVISVEGVTVLTVAGGTLTGSITLGENTGIALDPAGSADGKWSGITIAGTAGYAQTYGDLVYLDPTDSRWEKCDANAAAAADGDSRGTIGIVVVAGAADGNACTILLHGVIRADAAFPTFTVNNPIYVSETAGAVTQTQPTTADVVIRVVGFALTTDEMFFNPSSDYITHT